ncbi:unnamed protein product, partial [Adineta ricciae]
DCVAFARSGLFAAQLRVTAPQWSQSEPRQEYCAYCVAVVRICDAVTAFV